MNVDQIAAPSADAWKPDVGDTIKGVVTYIGTQTGDSYDKNRVEEKLKIVLNTEEGELAIWATTNTDIDNGGWAKRDAKAIAAAVRAAGESQLLAGGVLAVKRVADVKTERGDAKAYVAEYQAPAAGAEAVGDDAADGAVTGLI